MSRVIQLLKRYGLGGLVTIFNCLLVLRQLLGGPIQLPHDISILNFFPLIPIEVRNWLIFVFLFFLSLAFFLGGITAFRKWRYADWRERQKLRKAQKTAEDEAAAAQARAEADRLDAEAQKAHAAAEKARAETERVQAETLLLEEQIKLNQLTQQMAQNGAGGPAPASHSVSPPTQPAPTASSKAGMVKPDLPKPAVGTIVEAQPGLPSQNGTGPKSQPEQPAQAPGKQQSAPEQPGHSITGPPEPAAPAALAPKADTPSPQASGAPSLHPTPTVWEGSTSSPAQHAVTPPIEAVKSARTGQLAIHREHGSTVKALIWSQNGTHLYFTCSNASLWAWEPGSKQPGKNEHCHAPIEALVWQGAVLLNLLTGGVVIETVESVSRHKVWWGTSVAPTGAHHEHQHPITRVAVSPRGTYVASGDTSGIIHVSSTGASPQLLSPTGYHKHSSAVRLLVWSPDETLLASAEDYRNPLIWSPQIMPTDEPFTQPKPSQGVSALAWSPKSMQLAGAGTQNHYVYIWSRDNKGDPVVCQHSEPVKALGWSPDGTMLASGTQNGLVHLWESRSATELWCYHGHTAEITHIVWAPDGSGRIATASVDGTIQVWRPERKAQ
jgi:WD40 repeat protein